MKTRMVSILTRAAAAATIATVLFASAGMAHAATKGKSGTLKITAPTQVGGVVLEPGTYEVKTRNSGGASVVEFARWNYNPYAQEGLPVWDREVVATVNALPQTLTAAAQRTGLLPASSDSTRAVGLEIRCASVDYVF